MTRCDECLDAIAEGEPVFAIYVKAPILDDPFVPDAWKPLIVESLICEDCSGWYGDEAVKVTVEP